MEKAMNKKLLIIALAALPAVAMADDGVTIYGYMRAGVESLNGNGNAQFGLNANGVNAQKSSVNVAGRAELNFQGVENLGNGLSSVWQLSNRFSPTGSNTKDDEDTLRAGNFASNDSFVGLKDNTFGELRLGTNTGNFEDGKYDNSIVAGPDQLMGWFGDDEGHNMVRYDLPTLGGINSSIQYATEENKTSSFDGNAHTSLNVSYENNFWGLSAAYCSNTNASVGTVNGIATNAFSWANNQGATGTLKQSHLTGMIKPIESLQLAFEVQHDSMVGDSDTRSALYAYYTIGAFQLGMQGGVQTFSGNGSAALSNEKFVDAFAHYSLSKSTMVYLEALDDKNRNGDSNAGNSVMTILGVLKNF